MKSPLRRGLRRIVDALQLGLFDEPAKPADAQSSAPDGDGAWRHPQATREAVLDGRRVAFRLVRVRRRSIGFIVDVDGLTVRAPTRISLREIDAALQEKRRWVVGRLAEQRERAMRAAAARIVWRDGATIDHLGAPLTIVLDPGRAVAEHAGLAEVVSSPGARRLLIALPRDAAEERIRDAVQSWQQAEARRVFAARADHFAERLGVRVTRLALSSATTRWGSASADGSVRLHWRLIEHPLATIDYVVAHELAHLREMNHGPRFWRIVESVVPDHAEQRARLRHAGRFEV